jgi:glutamyl endopeptidase
MVSISPNRVIGTTDDRSRVTDTTTPPYVGIVYIEGTRCTGFLYKNNTVATAGHCVYDNDAWLNVGAIVPAKSGTSEPQGRCIATNLLASQAWINNRDFNYDFGAIKVNCTGSPTMLLSMASDSLLGGLNVNITGYPVSKNGEMWTGSGTITSVFATNHCC